MTPYSERFTNTQTALEAHKRALRAVCAQSLSRATGIGKRALDAYRCGPNHPPLEKFLRIATVMGPDYLNTILAPMGLGGVHRVEARDVNHHETLAAIVRVAHEKAEALKDGRIDHREAAALRPMLLELSRVALEAARALDR